MHRGSMAQVASWGGVVDTTGFGAKTVPGKDQKTKMKNLSGIAAFLFWRGAYWTMSVSTANKMLIPMYWFKAFFFGRDLGRF